MSGNICRCGCYPNIVAAIEEVMRTNPSEPCTMIDFDYVRAHDVSDAMKQIAGDPDGRFIAGGTNLIDLMKENVARHGG